MNQVLAKAQKVILAAFYSHTNQLVTSCLWLIAYVLEHKENDTWLDFCKESVSM